MSVTFDLPGGAELDGELDAESFAVLYARHREPLRRFCSARVGDPALVDDVVQDVFEKAFAQRAGFERGRDFWPWLASIAARTCIDAHRRAIAVEARNHQWAQDTYQEPFDVTSAAVLRAMHRRELAHHLAALPARQRAALGLYAFDEWTYEQIAENLGYSTSAVKALICRARAALRQSTWRWAATVVGGWDAARRRAHDVLARVQGWAWPTFETWASLVGGLSAGGSAVLAGVALVVGLVTPIGAEPAGPARLGAQAAVDAPSGQAPPRPAVAVGSLRARSGKEPVPPGHRPPTADAERAGHELAAAAVPPGGGGFDTPETVIVQSFAVSPGYEDDPTIYLVGETSGRNDLPATPLLVSHDGGASWRRARAAGLAPTVELLLPPAYPRDPRLFARTTAGLQVSHDGGETFETLLALPGIDYAAVSPGFNHGDRTILLLAGGGLVAYDDGSGRTRPVTVAGTPARQVLRSVGYATDELGRPVVLVGSMIPYPLAGAGAYFSRCTLAPGNVLAPRLDCEGSRISAQAFRDLPLRLPSTLGLDMVYVPSGVHLLVSADGGRSFRDTYADSGWKLWHTTADLAVVPSSGGASAVVAYRISSAATPTPLARTDDAGRTWRPLPVDVPNFGWGKRVAATPSGRILAGSFEGGIACSEDGGVSWARLCPTPDGRTGV